MDNSKKNNADYQCKEKIILDLCSGSGAWSKPYQEARGKNGLLLYDVRQITMPNHDVRLYIPPDHIYGILAAPPRTRLTRASAHLWKKPEYAKELLEALSIVDACLRIILFSNPVFWCLENPEGQLRKFLGAPYFKFNPWEYGGYCKGGIGNAYTKKTLLWGKFNIPMKKPVNPKYTDFKYYPVRSSAERSITPEGFAQAFFLSNQ